MLDPILRYAAQTLSVLLLLLLLRDGRRNLQSILLIGFLATLIADSIVTAPSEMLFPRPLYVIALFTAIPGSAFLWLLVRSILEDDFSLGWFEWSVMGFACTFKFGWVLHGLGIYPPLHSFRYWSSYALSLAMDGHILWLALAGFKNDLVIQRRKVRVWLLIAIGLAALTGTGTELLDLPSSWEGTIVHMMTVPLLLWIIMWLTKLDLNKLLVATPQKPDGTSNEIAPKDAAIHKRLLHVMTEEKAYADHGLSIRTLAERVGVPEHRLRILINQTMSYRNFSTFLNSYRIEYAKRIMADLDQARLPILTIAMDAGFQSLSTFNRAFKAMEGETPSTFRLRALRLSAASEDG